MPNLNMPVKFCTDENGNPYSPVVYQESMFNDDASRMDPVPRKMFAKAYDPTKTYPTENLFCIQDNKYYRFTGSGTTTGTFDPTKWTETDDATELTTLNSTLAGIISKGSVLIEYNGSFASNYLVDNNYSAWVAHYGDIYIVSGFFKIKPNVSIPVGPILGLNMQFISQVYGSIVTSDNKVTRYIIDANGVMTNETAFNTNNVWATFTSVLIKKTV